MYEFRAEDGEVIEKFYNMKNCPDIGKKITVKGMKYTRILCSGITRIAEFKPYKSITLPRNAKGFKTDKDGTPIVESRRQEQEYVKRERVKNE